MARYAKTVVFGDVHAPFHDKTAIDCLCRFLEWFRPEVVISNGDFIDCASVSKFTQNPITTPRLKDEIGEAKKLTAKIEKSAGGARLVFTFGNHEGRLTKFMANKAPELFELLLLEDLLGLKPKWEVVNGSVKENYVKVGDLYVGHWDRVSKFSAYTVKNIIADRGVSIVQSHTHRLGYYVATHFDRTIEGWEIGCLCNLNPAYVVNPNWQLGFGVIEPMNGGKDFSFTLVHVKRSDKFYYFRYGSKQFKVEVAK